MRRPAPFPSSRTKCACGNPCLDRKPAEEVRAPSQVYPKALFRALLTAGVVYVLVGLPSSIALPPEELSASTGPLLAVVKATGVGIPAWVFSLIALVAVAVANGALLTMIMASRVTYGMAEEGLLPSLPGKVLPRRQDARDRDRRHDGVSSMATTTGGGQQEHAGRDTEDPRRRGALRRHAARRCSYQG